jgi:large subunit ribosomal protein L10
MSKYVKNLVVQDIQKRLNGIQDALLVNVIGLDSGKTYLLRKKLREKNIHLLVVKNSLAKRAAEGTSLAPAFDSLEGSSALCWGGEDFVALAKEIVLLNKKGGEFEKFETRGGVLDGAKLSSDKVQEISKWPSRTEQLSILVGQILSPGANLLSQLTSPGGALASQIKQKSEGEEGGAAAAEGGPAPEGAPAAEGAAAAPATPSA